MEELNQGRISFPRVMSWDNVSQQRTTLQAWVLSRYIKCTMQAITSASPAGLSPYLPSTQYHQVYPKLLPPNMSAMQKPLNFPNTAQPFQRVQPTLLAP